MKKMISLFLLLCFLTTITFNCQQPETEYKTKVKRVPAESVIKCGVIFDKRSGTGGSDFIIATYGYAMPAATAPARAGYTFTGYYDAASGGTQYYNADMSGARNWDKTENTVLYAKWVLTYNLRDTGPAGGLIFYINPNAETDGWLYLECAPSSTEWTSKEWGKYGTSVGGTGTAIGTGKNNTALITAKLNEAPAESDRAAQLCDALSHNGYDDWFLPSRDELNLMYINLKQQGVGGLANDYYWSSSEYTQYSSGGAWVQGFGDGGQSVNGKNYTQRVRAVRAF
jgi:hypothetical protein